MHCYGVLLRQTFGGHQPPPPRRPPNCPAHAATCDRRPPVSPPQLPLVVGKMRGTDLRRLASVPSTLTTFVVKMEEFVGTKAIVLGRGRTTVS